MKITTIEHLRATAEKAKSFAADLFSTFVKATTEAIEEVETAKANKLHTHEIDDVTGLRDVIDAKQNLERVVLDEGALGKWACDFSGSDKLSVGSLSYDNDAFLIDKGHCKLSQSGGFATVTSDNNAVVGGRAYFIFPKFARSQTARKANLKIEFDIRIPVNSRWVVGLVDVDRRGDYAGGSSQDGYSLNGVAAWCGVNNETGLMKLNGYRLDQINSGIAEDKKNWSDKWIHFEAEVLNENKWATCYLKDPDTGEELAKTNMAFLDNNAAVNDISVTGIEFYTWWENHIDIDNVSVEIIGNWDNALYMYPYENGYRYFVTPTGASLYEIGANADYPDDITGKKLTISTADTTYANGSTVVEPLKVRDNRVDVLKTTTDYGTQNQYASSVISVQSGEIKIKANLNAKDNLITAKSIDTDSLSLSHTFGDGITFSPKDIHLGADTTVTWAENGMGSSNRNSKEFNFTDSQVSMDINTDGDKLTIASPMFKLKESAKDGGDYFSFSYGATKIRSLKTNSKGSHPSITIDQDGISMVGDITLINPAINCQLPDDITQGEITYLDNARLVNILLDLKRNAVLFGECVSENNATAKTVNIPGFELRDGTTVLVRFKNGHKAGTNLTLNINSTGAKDVLVNGVDGLGSYSTLEMATVILLTYSSLSDSYICVTPNNVDYANLAGSADGLSTGNTGSETEPVYFKNGEPVACDMYNYQKNPIQRIGTWLDGRPIWRYAFQNKFNTKEINEIKANKLLVIRFEDIFVKKGSYFPDDVCVIDEKCFLQASLNYASYIDDRLLPEDSPFYFTVPDEYNPNNITSRFDGYHGYIEFVTDESNIKK